MLINKICRILILILEDVSVTPLIAWKQLDRFEWFYILYKGL